MPKKQKEQRLRVYPRASVPGQVMVHNDKSLFVAPLINISAGGLYMQGLDKLPTGAVVRLVIKSPRLEKPIQAQGTIVRVERSERIGSAIQFTSISATARETIQNCVYENRMEEVLQAA